MQKQVKSINISYWFRELDNNPIIKIEELENSLNKIFQTPFLVNNLEVGTNISYPRIQAISSDKTKFFNMSLINANISINVLNEQEYDEIVLLINENVQLFYDVLKEVFELEILYTSIKVELQQEIKNLKQFQKKLNLKDDEYEDLSFKQVVKRDDVYYISMLLNTAKEVSFNIENKGYKPTQQDVFDRSMLLSVMDANINKEFLSIVVEINDRLAYNLDRDYLSNKENIRGMISELKSVFHHEIDELI